MDGTRGNVNAGRGCGHSGGLPPFAPVRVIGLMSGTSADAVDAALVDWPSGVAARPFRLLAYREEPIPAALRARIHGLAAGSLPAGRMLAELVDLDRELADRFAEAALGVLRAAGLPPRAVTAIASHGQTVAHHPELGGSLQLGDPSRIAERTGLPVVADFRARDLAAGGEGAPLAPFFHHVAFGRAGESRAVLNLGGIANLTWLPPDGGTEGVLAFDVGPAGCLVDEVVRRGTGGREQLDRGGRRARAGRVVPELLVELLDDEYLERPPPKSTGRERYGPERAESLLARVRAGRYGLDDLLATLVRATAQAVAGSLERFAAVPARLLVCGGGARNPAFLAALRESLPRTRVETTDSEGVAAEAVEAVAFSLLGRNAWLGLPNHLPACTGARGPRVLGERVLP